MTEENLEDIILKDLTPITITEYALEKANYISKIICELVGEPLEVYMLLLSEKGSEVIDDIYIAQEQVVSDVDCEMTGQGEIASYQDIKQNTSKRVVGWGHSHNFMDTFYSPKDDRNIVEIVEDGGGVKKTISLPIEIANEYGLEKLRIRFYLGMTFNTKGDEPFCAIAYSHSGEEPVLKKGLEYVVVENNVEELKPRSYVYRKFKRFYDRFVSEQNKISLDFLEEINHEKHYIKQLTRGLSRLSRFAHRAQKKEDNHLEQINQDYKKILNRLQQSIPILSVRRKMILDRQYEISNTPYKKLVELETAYERLTNLIERKNDQFRQ
jgi:hypothetical protein